MFKDFFARLRAGSSVTVNGKTYHGTNVEVTNGRVVVDGKVVDDQSKSPRIDITIHGSVERLETAAGDVTVNGSVASLSTAAGDVRCGAVSGNVTTVSGDVSCPAITGHASSLSGDIG